MREVPPDLYHRLREHGQEHVFFGWEKLTPDERRALADQVAGINLGELRRLYAERDKTFALPPRERIAPIPVEDADAIGPDDRWLGEEALARGEVAVLLVAGGQGSRLGFEKPKGMYPVGPISDKSLFQVHAEKVFALGRRYGRTPPFLVMTSPATHADTEAFFAENRFFGLSPDDVFFFQQGTMPALDLETGRLLLEKPGVLFSSPNGHGGTLTALADSGLLDALKQRGVRHVFYFQVDNPLVKVADPAFIGRHAATGSQASSKTVFKEVPEERVGVLALIDGRCSIIEYTEMKEMAFERDDAAGLLFRAGSPAIHVFDVDFLGRVTQGESRLPFHVAKKKVPCIDAEGRPLNPERENALKFEMFIFDALPLAERWLAVRTPREEEFAPLKNAEGADSPATVRQALLNLAGDWLERAGTSVPRDGAGNVTVPLEVSPRFALDAAEFAARVSPAFALRGPTYWE